ncbi:MAG: hypothetical protein ACHQ49_10045 [Elusimicrobiota bacterium]
MKMRSLAIFAVVAALAAACTPPKYASYTSVSNDFTARVPWGWNVIAEANFDGYSEVVFTGPFDPDFYLGAPSLSVRWYKPYRSHPLRDGQLEMYKSSDDFIKQTLRDVYGKDAIVVGVGTRSDGNRVPLEKNEPIPTVTLKESGLAAKYFAVLSPTRARAGTTVGTFVDENGTRVNQRYHEYAVVPIVVDNREAGFYVLCYPATMRGHDTDMDRFRNLMGTFRPLTVGPAGPKFRLPGPTAAGS